MTPNEYIQQRPDATDEEVLAAVNAPVYSPVPLADVDRWLTKGDRRQRFRDARDNESLPKELRTGLFDLMDALRSPNLATVDMTDAEIRTRWQQGAAGLAQVGVIDETERDFLLSLGVTQANYTQDDVTAARRVEWARTWYEQVRSDVAEGRASGKVPTEDELKAKL